MTLFSAAKKVPSIVGKYFKTETEKYQRYIRVDKATVSFIYCTAFSFYSDVACTIRKNVLLDKRGLSLSGYKEISFEEWEEGLIKIDELLVEFGELP